MIDRDFGPWAVVTGASSGIGAAFAVQLAAAGRHVVLVARRADRLATLAQQISTQYGVQTRAISADLSNADFLPALLAQTADLDIGLVISNAGYSRTQFLLDDDLDAQVDLLHVNTRAHLLLAHAFGNRLRERAARDGRRGALLLVASIVAFSATPRWANYAASKRYILALGEALALELRAHGVHVQVVCPGTTRTEFLTGAGLSGRRASMTAEQVADWTLRRLGRQTVIIPGRLNQLLVLGSQLVPRALGNRLADVILRLVERY